MSRVVSSHTPVKAVILRRSRMQSLIAFFPNRAGLAVPLVKLWDVGKNYMEMLKQLPTAKTNQAHILYSHTPRDCESSSYR